MKITEYLKKILFEDEVSKDPKKKAKKVKEPLTQEQLEARKSARTLYDAERKEKLRSVINRAKIEAGCVDCGMRDYVCLDFHHKKEEGVGEKIASLSAMLSKKATLKEINDEIDKCEVLCANCHRKRHNKKDNKYYENLAQLQLGFDK